MGARREHPARSRAGSPPVEAHRAPVAAPAARRKVGLNPADFAALLSFGAPLTPEERALDLIPAVNAHTLHLRQLWKNLPACQHRVQVAVRPGRRNPMGLQILGTPFLPWLPFGGAMLWCNQEQHAALNHLATLSGFPGAVSAWFTRRVTHPEPEPRRKPQTRLLWICDPKAKESRVTDDKRSGIITIHATKADHAAATRKARAGNFHSVSAWFLHCIEQSALAA